MEFGIGGLGFGVWGLSLEFGVWSLEFLRCDLRILDILWLLVDKIELGFSWVSGWQVLSFIQ